MYGIGEGASLAGQGSPKVPRSGHRRRVADLRRQTQRRALVAKAVIGGIACAFALYAIYAIERLVG